MRAAFIAAPATDQLLHNSAISFRNLLLLPHAADRQADMQHSSTVAHRGWFKAKAKEAILIRPLRARRGLAAIERAEFDLCFGSGHSQVQVLP